MSTGFGRKGLDTLEGNHAPPGGVTPAFAQARQAAAAQPAPMASRKKFDITPKPWLMLLCIGFFGACSLVMVNLLLDPRGVTINHMIDLGPTGADIFFGVLLLVSLGFVAIGVSGLVSSFRGKTWLTVDHNAVTAPSTPLRRKPTRIAFAEIAGMSMAEERGLQWVTIVGRGGKKIVIGNDNFRDKNGFAEFLDLIAERAGR